MIFKPKVTTGGFGVGLAHPMILVAIAAFGFLACDGGTADNTTRAARIALGSTDPNITWIRTLADLRNMRLNLNGNYKLANNIDASSTSTSAFVPVGGIFNAFFGTFDGGTFTISNLHITGADNTGLFGSAINAVLKNIHLNNVTVKGSQATGAIAGFLQNTQLSKSYVTGIVTGTSSPDAPDAPVGMAVGIAATSTVITQCYATGTVNGVANPIGGFVGRAQSFGIADTGGVDPTVFIQEVFTNVNVNPNIPTTPGNIVAGGLVGFVQGAWIQDINVVGSVRGRGAAGGVLGYVVNDDPASVATMFRQAVYRGNVTVSAGVDPAGTMGFRTGTFLRCTDTFYNIEADRGVPIATDDITCNTGYTTDQLRAPHPDPNRLITPYINGQLITQAGIDGPPYFEQCKLASGSDGDWGFGATTCPDSPPQVWALNSSTEYCTLVNIPNPSVQPK